jgi:hypothetical protein
MKRAAFSLATLFVLGALPLAAQNAISSGAITGCVRDPLNGVLDGAAVSVISNDTGLQVGGTSNSGGLYYFPLIKVGRYTLRVRHDHFKTTEFVT